jgi:3-hydroxyisobutyrate dehydrogenase
MTIGFVGLGVMGQPMAINLARAHPVIVWNRSVDRTRAASEAGAAVASSVDEVFREAQVVFLMLADGSAIDEVLGRGSQLFGARVRGRTVVHLGTTPPEYSQDLGADIDAAGGSYVECPVSGSRLPAEEGALVAMLAGEAAVVEQVRPLLASMCRQSFDCGRVPGALHMKLAVNLFLITLVTGLAESVHLAARNGSSLEILRQVLDSGPMGSTVSRGKLEKFVNGDYAVQASAANVLYNNELIAESARKLGAATPLLDRCHQLFREAVELGHGGEDMIAVLHAISAYADEPSDNAITRPSGTRSRSQ